MIETAYFYTFSSYEGERSLMLLEMRSFFGCDSQTGLLESRVKIDPSRSPFIKERVAVICQGNSFEELLEEVKILPAFEVSFKLKYVKRAGMAKSPEERRSIEKELGLHIDGRADLHDPDRVFGVMNLTDGRWIFGDYVKSEPIWHHHQQKPHSYSTALNTRVARAVANIAIPKPEGIKAIDPCCGIGTVLVEALSMGIDIVGSDRNPLVLGGTRENIAHFGYSCEVKLKDMLDIVNHYDVAIIDMPYNLCSVISPEEQLKMLQSARQFAEKAVVVTVEPIDHILIEAGFSIMDRAVVRKGAFEREVIVCY
ncbi:TRM11 family SAM-dependent methyltransferase [Bacillus sp. B-jedd]|uniref:TRM11 family SAM-dependent methyltransferase n=1 Tax=Bacillus sp. B-jedd TaxID=1476857 RepID=UPI0005155CA3|nr:RsmD family RNA methyltransferase [Bacillus sp. B-jedd]CEG26291.1 methyltransferase [Bacillus sp. B-jedd]